MSEYDSLVVVVNGTEIKFKDITDVEIYFEGTRWNGDNNEEVESRKFDAFKLHQEYEKTLKLKDDLECQLRKNQFMTWRDSELKKKDETISKLQSKIADLETAMEVFEKHFNKGNRK